MFRHLLILLAMLTPMTAHAEWTRAESRNFIAYSEGGADDLKKRVADLEKFGLILQALTGAKRPREVPVKITVYFMRTTEEVQETLPFPTYGVAGYYNTTMRGPFTVMPRISARAPSDGRQRGLTLSAKAILQHELTHHFTFQYFTTAYPAWYTEGFADYAGAIEIDDTNVVKLGLFLQDRAASLRTSEWVPLRQLMNPDPRKPGPGFAVYSQGWITVHYLNSTPEGRKMLNAYLTAISRGATFGDALKVFGDIDALDREVRAYSRRSTLDATAIRYENLDVGPIEVRSLSPAEDALLPIQISLSSGVAAKRAQSFADRVRDLARPYPDDPYARRILIDAEYLAGNDAGAMALADRWLAAQPADPWANYFKGEIETAMLVKAKSTDDPAWAAARARIAVAMKAIPTEPRFARAYYESYSRRGILPPAPAQNALVEAMFLIPREGTLRYMVAADFEQRGMIDEAIATIGPLAFGIADETDREKRRRERVQEQYREAGDDTDRETPREMLVRLLAKKDAADSAKPATPAAQ